MEFIHPEKAAIMNQQLFNKKETIFLLPQQLETQSPPVSKEVLAGMLANMEALGYQFSIDDIKQMAGMSEETLTTAVYHPLLNAMREAKGEHVEHHLLFPDFPTSARTIDIDTLSDFRFMSYFTTAIDEYLLEQNAFHSGSVTMSLMDELRIYSNKQQREAKKTEIETPNENSPSKLITVHLGAIEDYYQMVHDMLQSKTSLSAYDKEVVLWALENVDQTRFMPESIPFKENWALVAKYNFEHQHLDKIPITNYKDFERLLAVLSKQESPQKQPSNNIRHEIRGDVSLSQKQHFRNFSNQERKQLFQVFNNGIRNHYASMLDSALTKYAKQFTNNVLFRRLHFDKMKNADMFLHFQNQVKQSRSVMYTYETQLQSQDYRGAEQTLQTISTGQLLRHAKSLVSHEEQKHGQSAAINMIDRIMSDATTAPMDILLSLRQQVKNNISAEEEPAKFYFARTEQVRIQPYANTAQKLSPAVQGHFLRSLDAVLRYQLQSLPDIGKVYIDEQLKHCPIPLVGRTDSGKNRTVMTGTKLPVPEMESADILRAALYKKGEQDGFLDFSCAFLDENYRMVGQISWNNLKYADAAYHSGDAYDTTRGVTEVIDVDISKFRQRIPSAKYITYQALAYEKFTKIDNLSECFLTLSSVSDVGTNINANALRQADGDFGTAFNPADVKMKIDLTGNTYTNIPLIYDIDAKQVTILNLATSKNITQFGQPDVKRHFDLPTSCEAIENYAGELALTTYYINERIEQDKPSIYDLAMLNVQARNGVLVENKEDADVIFSIDREETGKEQELVSIFDKADITTKYMVPDMSAAIHQLLEKEETKEKKAGEKEEER